MIFNIDIKRLVRLFLPTSLRKERIVAFMDCLTEPMQKLYLRFKANRESNLYRLDITSQVCKLEKMLNDRFDVFKRRIKITDSQFLNINYIYLDTENKPLILGEQTLFLTEELGAINKDFEVLVPSDISFNHNEMTGLINSYKLATKTFLIKTV